MNLSTSWIWLDSNQFQAFQKTRISQFDRTSSPPKIMAVFRKTFSLSSVPEKLTANFSGDCKFRLFINGKFVDDGPVEIGGDYLDSTPPDWWFYDTRDLTSFFQQGQNVIVAEVLTEPDAQTDYSVGHPGFTFELESENTTLLRTDETWKGFVNSAFVNGNYRAGSAPGDYHSSSFDDSLFPPAEKLAPEICAKWNLKKLDLPPLSETAVEPEEPNILYKETLPYIKKNNPDGSLITILPGPLCVFQLRFPEKIVGHIEFEVESLGGATILLEYQEIPGHTHYREGYTTASGKHFFRSTRLNVFKYIQISVSCGTFSSQQYSPVKIHSFKAQKRAFPLPGTAHFSCSDQNLMKIRECVDRTMRMCMMRMHLDSPLHQEGLGCTGDYMIEALISYALYGETRLADADIRRTGYLLKQTNGVLFHTSYSLLFIDMVRDCYMQTGNRELVKSVYPQIKMILNRFATFTGKSGLLSDAPNYLFIDWVNDGGFNYHHPPSSRGTGSFTAFYAHALQTAANLADELGESGDAGQWIADANKLKDAFQQLWDDEKGCYRDGIPHLGTCPSSTWLPQDDDVTAFSVHTNALALAFGFVPENKKRPLLDKMMCDRTLIQPQPYFMHFVFEALLRTDSFEQYGFELLNRWIVPVNEHPDGLKECWNCGDYCHAWGGTPAYQMTRSILGVSPRLPGWKKIAISPNFGALTFVSATIPSPAGTIEVEFRDGTASFTLPRRMRYELESRYKTTVTYR